LPHIPQGSDGENHDLGVGWVRLAINASLVKG